MKEYEDPCCELKLGQVEVWLVSEETFSGLISCIVQFFGLKGKESISCIELNHSLVHDTTYMLRETELISYRKVPEGLKGWLIESEYINDKFALCALVHGWIMSSGGEGEYFGVHGKTSE